MARRRRLESQRNRGGRDVKTQHQNRAVFAVKIAQRLALLPDPVEGRPVRVLDCYAGDHVIWNTVRRWRDDLQVVHIEKDTRFAKTHPTDLRGDNLKYLGALDLERFDGIDLDAWGLPTKQFAAIARREYGGVVWFTANSVGYGKATNELLLATGVPTDWALVCQTLVAPMSERWPALAGFLAECGWSSCVLAQLQGAAYNYGAVGYGEWQPARYNDLLREVLATPVLVD